MYVLLHHDGVMELKCYTKLTKELKVPADWQYKLPNLSVYLALSPLAVYSILSTTQYEFAKRGRRNNKS